MFFPPKPVHLGFPQMRLLNQVLAKQKFKKQNNPWWLNLIRMVLIALLVFSLVGLRWGTSQIDQDSSLALIYDDTFYGHQRNDRGESQWGLERKQVLDLLVSIDPNHRVALVGRSGSLMEWTSATQALDWFRSQSPGFLGENWTSVLKNITRLHRQRENLGFQILFTGSDASQNPSGFKNLLTNLPTGVRCDLKLFSFQAIPNRSLFLRASSQGGSLILQGKVRGEDKGKLLISSSEGNPTSVDHQGRFRKSLPELSWLKVQLEGEDGFPLDDIVHISNQQARPRRLFLLLRPEANERLRDSGYYLEQGFRLIAKNLGLELMRMGPRQWKQLKARRGDLVLLLHPPQLGRDEWKALGESLTQGAHLLLFPGPSTPEDLLDDFNLSPARLKMGPGGTRKILWAEEWKKLAPEVTASESKGGWDFIHINPKAQIQQRYDHGGAHHLRMPFPGGGSFQLMSSPMAIHWSSSVLQPDFPAFLEHLLDSSLPPPPFPERLAPGESWPSNITSIQTFDEAIEGAQQYGPGVYKVDSTSGESAILTRRFPPESYLPRHPLPKISSKENLNTSISTAAGPRVDPIFALAIALFLGLEALVLRRQIPHLLNRH